METLRTAIVGCGGIANTHAQRLAGKADVKRVGLCDRVTERADAFGAFVDLTILSRSDRICFVV